MIASFSALPPIPCHGCATLSFAPTSLRFLIKRWPKGGARPRRAFPFVRAAGDGANGMKQEDEENVADSNRKNGGDLKKERQRPGAFNLRWRDLLSPDADNALAVALTGLLTWASVQVVFQLFFISVAILLAALKKATPRHMPRENLTGAGKEMELEEWELLPDTKSFLELGHEAKRDVVFKELIVDVNYFICPSLPLMDRKLIPSSSAAPAEEAQKKELVEEFKDIAVVLPAAIAVDPHRHDVVSQVFFKKLIDNEFVDMKVGSPRGATLTHLEPEGKEEEEEEKEEAEAEDDRKGDGCEPMNTWNRRLVGVGAFCSLGAAAAATAFMFVLGGRHLQSQQHSHRIQFCIYSDDKRTNGTTRTMMHRATRPNQAHISFGGYCATA